MAAPRPRPPALKLLNGRSPGRDSGGRKVEPPPSFVRTAPNPPSWLPREAKAEWRRIVPELDRLKLLKGASRSSLTAYCLAWDRFVDAHRLIARDGILSRNSQGVGRHPAVAIAEAASKELRSWCIEFGMTPSAEGRLTVPEAIDGDGDFD